MKLKYNIFFNYLDLVLKIKLIFSINGRHHEICQPKFPYFDVLSSFLDFQKSISWCNGLLKIRELGNKKKNH